MRATTADERGNLTVQRDALGRETVLREPQLDGNGDFQKYVLRYWHEAQPRNDGRGKPQTSTMISAVEGNSLFMWNTVFDAADVSKMLQKSDVWITFPGFLTSTLVKYYVC